MGCGDEDPIASPRLLLAFGPIFLFQGSSLAAPGRERREKEGVLDCMCFCCKDPCLCLSGRGGVNIAMVSFSCDECQDVVKKPKVENHLRICGSRSVSCVDCGVRFSLPNVKGHTTCMTEREKYEGGKTTRGHRDSGGQLRLWERNPKMCLLCNLKINGAVMAEQHYTSKKHKAKERKARREASGTVPDSEKSEKVVVTKPSDVLPGRGPAALGIDGTKPKKERDLMKHGLVGSREVARQAPDTEDVAQSAQQKKKKKKKDKIAKDASNDGEQVLAKQRKNEDGKSDQREEARKLRKTTLAAGKGVSDVLNGTKRKPKRVKQGSEGKRDNKKRKRVSDLEGEGSDPDKTASIAIERKKQRKDKTLVGG